MKISTNWIKDYVNIEKINYNELAERITKAGVNVEQVEHIFNEKLVTAEIKEIIPVENSKKLSKCKVFDGEQYYQVVCGAPNIKENMRVILAKCGAVLPKIGEIKETNICGISSSGMLCALFELGLEEESEENYKKGIIELDSNVPLGKNPYEVLGYEDTIYTLDLNPNRTDCLSHLGFAYEVAAVIGEKVKLPDINYEKNSNEELNIKIEVETDNCPLYNIMGATNIKIKESPDFIKRRLNNVGIKSINNVVDISNYIMLEYGQPIHFYDKKKVGDKIIVRMAKDDENIELLDNRNIKLSSQDIIVANSSNEPICIAGVMGGRYSGISEDTNSILIESAIFNPYNVRYTSIRNLCRTEAAIRFEKQLCYEYTNLAIKRACFLLEKYADAKILNGIETYNIIKKEEKVAKVSSEKINTVLGINLQQRDILEQFEKLGFGVSVQDNEYVVTIPNRRVDVSIAEDLIEEVGRLYGYDNIEGKVPILSAKKGSYIGKIKYRKNISKYLRSIGLNEARTYTLIGEKEDALIKYENHLPIKLLKPMTEDKSIIRRSLIPSIIKTIQYNISRQIEDVYIYEIANVYYNDKQEECKICIGIYGNSLKNKWNGVEIKADFYLIKGMIEGLLDYLGFKNNYKFVELKTEELHPGISAKIQVDGENVGIIGKINPKDCDKNIFVCEISLDKLFKSTCNDLKYIEPSKFPKTVKDISFVLPKNIKSIEVEEVIRKSVGEKLQEVSVFDVYMGERIMENKKAIAYSLTISSKEKTLTDLEVNTIMENVEKNVCEKFGAEVRK